MSMPRSADRVVKRIAAGLPQPSPKVNVDPPTVVTRRFPARIKFSNAHRSNRSIGRLLPHQARTGHASTQLTSTGVDSRACDFDLGELEQSLYPTAMRMIQRNVANW